MARRSKWVDRLRGNAPAWLSKYRSDAGKGYSRNPVDWNPNINSDRVRGEWIEALTAADESGKLGSLIALLESDRRPSSEELRYLTDLLKRVKLIKKRGGKTTPSYDMTDAEKWLSLAIGKVREREDRASVANALDAASKQYGIPRETLDAAYYGRRASTRRMAKRRPPLNPGN